MNKGLGVKEREGVYLKGVY